MLRTNSNAFRAAVRMWIMANYTPEDYDSVLFPADSENMNNFPAVAASIADIFECEKGCEITVPYLRNRVLVDWMQGLPGILHTLDLCIYCRVHDLLASWMQGDYKKPISDTDAANRALLYVAREIIAGKKEYYQTAEKKNHVFEIPAEKWDEIRTAIKVHEIELHNVSVCGNIVVIDAFCTDFQAAKIESML